MPRADYARQIQKWTRIRFRTRTVADGLVGPLLGQEFSFDGRLTADDGLRVILVEPVSGVTVTVPYGSIIGVDDLHPQEPEPKLGEQTIEQITAAGRIGVPQA
jgi:hypothetical protein